MSLLTRLPNRPTSPTEFTSFLAKQKRLKEAPKFTFLSLDPGHTTGAALWVNSRLVAIGQHPYTHADLYRLIELAKESEHVKSVVIEDYRIYQHKAKEHVNSPVLTLRLIGAIELAAQLAKLPIFYQMASEGKSWAKDYQLKRFGLFQQGKPHANDAIRHGVHAMLFKPYKLNQATGEAEFI